MNIPITQEQAQRLVAIYNESRAAQARMAEALQTLAPGISDAILREVEGSWFLTDEAESEPESEAEDGERLSV